MSILLYILVLFPILLGLITYFLSSRWRAVLAVAGSAVEFILAVLCFVLAGGNTITAVLGGWSPPVGILLRGDTVALVFCMLTAFLFLNFTVYNLRKAYLGKIFYMLFLTLQGLLTGIFLADDLFSIFVLVEVSTMVVSLLIMFKRDSRSMYDGLIYLLINTFSMTLFLLGLALLYRQLGTFSLSYIAQIIGSVENVKALYLPYALLMTSVCLKSAIMPLFSWLPKAHGTPSAPSVVSAVLSGLYVKGGIYLFFRLQQAFYTIDAHNFFFICGIITAVVGFVFAISQRDIKMILSYSTVSQLGLILLALNLGTPFGTWAGLYHIVNHALFKSVLFLCSGLIVEAYETRDIYKISGVFQRMPLVSIACIAAILGITGAPFFNGSISKYLIAYGTYNAWMPAVFIFINFGTLLIFVKFIRIFKRKENVSKVIVPKNRSAVLVVLSTFCLLGGLFGTFAIRTLFGVDVHIDAASYLSKSLVFGLTLMGAFAIYLSGIPDSKAFSAIRALDLGFNEIALTIPAFLFVLLGYLVFL